jgi:hypothetical protein
MGQLRVCSFLFSAWLLFFVFRRGNFNFSNNISIEKKYHPMKSAGTKRIGPLLARKIKAGLAE